MATDRSGLIKTGCDRRGTVREAELPCDPQIPDFSSDLPEQQLKLEQTGQEVKILNKPQFIQQKFTSSSRSGTRNMKETTLLLKTTKPKNDSLSNAGSWKPGPKREPHTSSFSETLPRSSWRISCGPRS